MTAKLRTGLNIADASGADDGSTHSQLMKDHRRPGRPEGASIHSFDPRDPDDRESDDAGIADIHQGMPDDSDEAKGEGPDMPDATPERLRQGEHATTDGTLNEDD